MHHPPPDESRSELGRLTDVLRLLESLNDPQVQPPQIARTVTGMPSLAARVAREYARMFPERELPASMDAQLSALGHKRFERLLYDYLEELAQP